jgi:hypothetical protein
MSLTMTTLKPASSATDWMSDFFPAPRAPLIKVDSCSELVVLRPGTHDFSRSWSRDAAAFEKGRGVCAVCSELQT